MQGQELATPAVSVVVATRNRRHRLAALIDSLGRQSVPPERFELIVVDDGSTDETAEYLAQASRRNRFQRFAVIRRNQAGGPAAARNSGWRDSRAPFVAFTDDDCEADPRWLEHLLDRSNGERVALQGRTEPIPREVEQVSPFARTLRVDRLGPFFPTCNMAYPRALLEELGGFDESYPEPGGEDTDLALRALESGAGIEFAESALIFHAVNDYGPVGKLRWALHWSHAMKVFARHPSLRRELHLGIFWKRSHALLLLALVGLALAPRYRLASFLALPYLRHLRHRCYAENAPVHLAPYFAIYDVVETFAAARGGARARVLVL